MGGEHGGRRPVPSAGVEGIPGAGVGRVGHQSAIGATANTRLSEGGARDGRGRARDGRGGAIDGRGGAIDGRGGAGDDRSGTGGTGLTGRLQGERARGCQGHYTDRHSYTTRTHTHSWNLLHSGFLFVP